MPIQRAVQQLIDEADKVLRDQKLPSVTADFVKRFDEAIPAAQLLDALAKPAHKDPFIDAYVRWQLTSFEIDLPELSDEQFLQLLANAPRMFDNPRADAAMIAVFETAEQSPRLSERDIKRLRDMVAELDRRTPIAEALNVPAEAWRDWLITELERTGEPALSARKLLCLIERCAATIDAGWSTRTIKGRMTKAFRAAGNDPAITLQQREMIAEHARRLAGMNRSSINEITFLANGTLRMTLSNAAVSKGDVDEWLAAMLRK